MLGFRKIDFRNSKYQGLISDTYQPHGEGILLDDQLRFILTEWRDGAVNGNTLVFDSHSKYIYGMWKDGLPEGINIYRGGETVLVANFEKGSILGRFLVIFQVEGIMITAQTNQNRTRIISKTEDIRQQDIIKAANQISPLEDISKLISLIGFLKSIQKSNVTGVELTTENNLQFLGINDGLGILFDQNNYIHKVGAFLNKNQIAGIGGVYSADEAQEGDFESGIFVNYTDQRPSQQLKSILKQAHLKSMTFVNSYVVTKVSQTLGYLNSVLKQQVLAQLNQEIDLSDSRRFNMNDSLDYHPKNNSENERLKKMRAELYLSIGRPGSEIKPIPDIIVNQFIEVQQKQKRQKGNKSSLYLGYTKKSSYDYINIDLDERQPTARFEENNWRQTSPGRNKHLASLRYTNISPTKTIEKGEIAAWKEENNKKVIQSRKSRSPPRIDISNPRMNLTNSIHNSSNIQRASTKYNPSVHQTASIIPATSSHTFGGHSSNLIIDHNSKQSQKSRNTISHATASFNKLSSGSISNIKYEDIKQRRARLLNEYKQIGGRSSPLGISPFRQKQSPRNQSPRQLSRSKASVGKNTENTMYGSPYNDMKSSKIDIRHSRKQSNDIKTISRRIDKSQILPTRSPAKYSYLNSYM